MTKVKWFLCTVTLVLALVILPGALTGVHGDGGHLGPAISDGGSS